MKPGQGNQAERWVKQHTILIWVSFQFVLLAADSGVDVTVTRGQSAVLQCPLETTMTEGVISWYKQISGQGPILVLSYGLSGSSLVRYGVGFHRERFSAQPRTNHSDSGAHQLLISTAEEADAATYYCGVSDRNETELGHQ
ncbi:secreted immunoglobulin domain 1 isoform X2 [Engraulis encrasicolus]|uniref:secreted immunoglobulin domain 1 isoform X2 n=1 Tax=Engraulis encrasicolus TaxID=184585 RepID=UPI002FD6F465